jgi:hypothetical protein
MFRKMLVGSALVALIGGGAFAFLRGKGTVSEAVSQEAQSADVGKVAQPPNAATIRRLNDYIAVSQERSFLMEQLIAQTANVRSVNKPLVTEITRKIHELPTIRTEELIFLFKVLAQDRPPSPQAIDILIRWLEFEDHRLRLKQHGINVNNEYIGPDYPAEKALMEMGTAAVPQLVDEYIHCATTGPEGRRRRIGRIQTDERHNPILDKNGEPLPLASPSFRLNSIVLVLIHSPEVARAAVEYADKLWADNPHKPRVRAVCRELIEDIVSQFWQPEHRGLFPTYFPTAPPPRAVTRP